MQEGSGLGVIGLTMYNGQMKSVSISEFKAHCLQLLAQIASTGEGLLVTKRGKPLVSVTALPDSPSRRKLGASRRDVVIVGDIVSPFDEPWEALS